MAQTHGIVVATKAEQVFQHLREEIVQGRMPPGVMYSAASLAESLRVSRTPVNHAIQLLHSQGLIELHPNVGFQVVPFQWQRIEELMQIKTQMEKLALQRMELYAEPQHLEKLGEGSRAIRRAVEAGDADGYYQSSLQYHLLLCDAGKAVMCRDYFEKYWDYEGLYAVNMAENRAALLAICDDHDEMLAAVASRDFAKAVAQADGHMARCLALIQKNLPAGP